MQTIAKKSESAQGSASAEKPTRREKERLRRVELILGAAEELFFERGFAATTMNDIGDAAEFSRASLYNYFPSKEKIYAAILVRAMDQLVSEAESSTVEAEGAAAKIHNLKDAILSFIRRRPAFFHLYFITRFEVIPDLDGELAEQLEQETKRLERIFHEIYREGVSNAELRECDPMAMGDIFFAQIVGLLMMSRTETLEPPLAANVDQATDFFLDGIKSVGTITMEE
jgi:AcrR family transcriptional regulator